MKIITFSVAVILVSVSCQPSEMDKFWEKYRQKIEDCEKETMVDRELLKKSFLNGEFPDDRNIKCYFKCIMQKEGEMDENGKVDFSSMADHVPPNVDQQKARDIIGKCSTSKIVGNDPCDVAYEVAKCLRELFFPN